MADRRTIVIFGAGKIGRSFIGQLFGLSGYVVVFVDIDRKLVNALPKVIPTIAEGIIKKIPQKPGFAAGHHPRRTL